MANVKISALPAVTTVVPGSDVLPLVSGGITTKATPNQIVQAVLPAPGAIGGTTPNAGAFTTLSASSTVSGTGFSTYLASPPAIGGTVAAAITGTTITANTSFAGALNGTVGATTPNAGAFTTLSASSTVSGTGFSNYLASPPAIGGTAAAAGKFTTLEYTSTLTGGTGVIAIGTNQIYKDSSGNVGIGTSSPASKLNVSTTANEISRFVSTNATGGYIEGLFDNTTPWYLGSAKAIISGNLADFSIVGGSGTTGNLVFGTAGTEKMRLDSSGNLGLGVTPSAWGSDRKPIQLGGGGSVNGSVSVPSFVELGSNFYNNSSSQDIYLTTAAAAKYRQVSGAHSWYIAASGTAGNPITFTQAMTLDASGNLLVGTTSTQGGKVNIKFTSGSTYGLVTQGNVDNVYHIVINNAAGTAVGSIYATNSATTFNTSSDQRLKTNIIPAGSAIQSILDFPVDQFDWISTGEHQDFGAVAQKAINVIPEMVSVPADEDEMWGIDWSKAVPRLIRTIQEMHTEIQELKAKVNA